MQHVFIVRVLQELAAVLANSAWSHYTFMPNMVLDVVRQLDWAGSVVQLTFVLSIALHLS